MKIEIVTIGTEVVRGFTVNTNVAYISQELLKAGFVVSRHTTLPDEATALREGLQDALERSDLVITTGGLGPTQDDITRNIAAKLFDSDFHYDEEVAEDLKRRFSEKLPTLKDQATVPSKAEVMKNPVGTAPGFIIKNLIMLPGVPNEMKSMFTKQVLPYINSHFPSEKPAHCKVLNLVKVFEFQVDPFLRELNQKYPDVEFGIYPALGLLSIRLSTDKTLEKPYQELVQKYAPYMYESPSGKIEEAIQLLFIKNGWTLSVAESCTGGSIAAQLTRIPGASDYFLGSLVVYSNELKTQLLNVPADLIKEKGAVSEECVNAMVSGLLQTTVSDFGIAVSGIAGPAGGTPERPVGTIWAAIVKKGNTIRSWKMQLKGNRDTIIDYSVNAVLGELLRYAKP